MGEYQSLNHTKWECKYHIIWVPKYRKKIQYGEIRRMLGGVIWELAGHRELKIPEEHLINDHVHILIEIPPKYSVAQVVGYIKGKSTIQIARQTEGRRRNFIGQHFWARGYFASTVGIDREYYENTSKPKRQKINGTKN